MNIEERKTLESLTKDYVCVKTQHYLIKDDGTESPIDDLHSIAYVNTKEQRDALKADQPEDIASAVFTIWGDLPTIKDQQMDENLEEKG